MFKLTIVAVVPEHCSGPGWQNSVVWVYMAPIKRALYDLLGETMIQTRAKKLALAHSPNPQALKAKFTARAINRKSVERIERDAKKHIEDIKNS